ncbi:recombinase family protein [Aphanothece sacrum]|uniref:recombinase family protein n=1 Tax=Aphanothece sacrum TaxID=1122 RepID=UPI000F61372F|nr:recombinase family protein [Aphanothece sacrum]GBF84831.1 cyanobacterial membrane protein [Aphanothece sacrum FPU3]
MELTTLWIEGITRSGKTHRLIQEFTYWVELKRQGKKSNSPINSITQELASSVLILAANDDNRRELADQLSLSVQRSYPVICKTPLGFIRDEVILFWPLLFEKLNLKAQFPLLLRPETEQELATKLWRPQLDQDYFKLTRSTEYRFVRQTLDLLLLAGASGTPIEDIPYILDHHSSQNETILDPTHEQPNLSQLRGQLIIEWQEWCLNRGLLTYGLIYSLYWRYLLPNTQYQHHLTHRYQAIFADDVDDYPAITKDLIDILLNNGVIGRFTYNPHGQIRLGLNADPQYLSQLASRCQVELLPDPFNLSSQYGDLIVQLATDPLNITPLPDQITSIQTISRAQLLRQTAEFIINAIKQNKIKPQDIVIIAPGLDDIARYTLSEILTSAGISLKPLNEQRPLISFSLVRALLSLLGLIYPGLGRLILGDDIAQMLTILSQQPDTENNKLVAMIDPVRAGLIADYCYHIDQELPKLLPVESFPRWDRLGYRATQSYHNICHWIDEIKLLQKQDPFLTPIIVLDRAIKHFFGTGKYLAYEELAALRELIETTQHYWEIDGRLRQHNPTPPPSKETLIQFIQLLRRGTITANPRPIRNIGKKDESVTLATIFQYRSLRHSHPWQIWLDASSVLWEKGGASVLFCAPLFLRKWSRHTLSHEDEFEADKARLERILRDLLGRVTDKIILCHSDLNIKGTEQMGPLLTLINGS